jgi:lipid A 3-O-deacylase
VGSEKGIRGRSKVIINASRILFIIILTIIPQFLSLADQISIYEENDFIFHTDSKYTQGARIKYTTDGGQEFSINQNMYTPDNKEAYQLLPEDRPYAGYSYLAYSSATLLRNYLVEYELQLGVVGPDAYAKQVQDFVHKITGSHLCNGWANQIPNHFEAQTWTKLSYPTDISRWFDAVPNATLAVGTLQDYASLGGTMYLGYNLPKLKVNHDIPVKLVSLKSLQDFRLYLDGGAEVRAVAYNALLEDPRFDIDVCPVVCRGYAGVTAEYKGYALTFQLEEISDEFDPQPAPEKFGSLQLMFRF